MGRPARRAAPPLASVASKVSAPPVSPRRSRVIANDLRGETACWGGAGSLDAAALRDHRHVGYQPLPSARQLCAHRSTCPHTPAARAPIATATSPSRQATAQTGGNPRLAARAAGRRHQHVQRRHVDRRLHTGRVRALPRKRPALRPGRLRRVPIPHKPFPLLLGAAAASVVRPCTAPPVGAALVLHERCAVAVRENFRRPEANPCRPWPTRCAATLIRLRWLARRRRAAQVLPLAHDGLCGRLIPARRGP